MYEEDWDDEADTEETSEEDSAFRRKLIAQEFKKRRKVIFLAEMTGQSRSQVVKLEVVSNDVHITGL